jgi:hypothetical protein
MEAIVGLGSKLQQGNPGKWDVRYSALVRGSLHDALHLVLRSTPLGLK